MNISVIFGTRPEAIKLSPLILALKEHPDIFNCRVCVSAQHREMLDQVLQIFQIVPDVDLDLMVKDQTLAGFTARAITAIDHYLQADKPDMIIVQGDTTTVFCAALAAFYNNIPVAHVEAGLRTGNYQAPWPEEMNRVLASRLSSLHFAPTLSSQNNLLKEGIPPDSVFVTGNTVIDALFQTLEKIKNTPPAIPGLSEDLILSWKNNDIVLITGHRRENFGEGFRDICNAIRRLATTFPDVQFIYPVHLNPNVQGPVAEILGKGQLPNIHLISPLPYFPFVRLMNLSKVILTDSGGIQEEAPSLGKPVLVMREETERPEAVEAGTVKLVGTDTDKICKAVSELLTNDDLYTKMSASINPYGDGLACKRIVDHLLNYKH